jgi:hypothetical protein
VSKGNPAIPVCDSFVLCVQVLFLGLHLYLGRNHAEGCFQRESDMHKSVSSAL